MKPSSLNIPSCDAEIFTVVQRKVVSGCRMGCCCCEFTAAAQPQSKDPRDFGAAVTSAFVNLDYSVSTLVKNMATHLMCLGFAVFYLWAFFFKLGLTLGLSN